MTHPELTREEQEELGRRRRRRLGLLDRTALAWLALVPAWTERLARACHFPTPGETLEEFLSRTESAGLCLRPPRADDEDREATPQRARALVALMPHLPSAERETALSQLDEVTQAQVRLRSATPDARRALVEAGAAAAQRLRQPGERCQALTALAEELSPPERKPLVQGALRAVELIQPEGRRALALERLAPLLDTSFPEAAAVADSLASPEARAHAWTALARFAGAERWPHALRKALDSARRVSTPWDRVKALAAVLRELRASQPTEVEGVSLSTVTAEALAAARAVEPALAAVEALALLLSLLDPDSSAATALAALAVAKAILAERPRALALIALLPHLPNAFETVSEALATIGTLEPGKRGPLLATLAPYVSPEVLSPEVLFNAAPIPWGRAEVLVAVAARHSEFVPEALDAVAVVPDEEERASALVRLAAQLSDTTLLRALRIATALTDDEARARALAALAPRLRGDLTLTAFAALQPAPEPGHFWMPDGARTEVLRHLTGSATDGVRFLTDQASRIGREVLAQRAEGQPVSPVLVRWAEMAREVEPVPGTGGSDLARAAAFLKQRVGSQAGAGDMAEAESWLRAGRSLAGALGGELVSAVRECAFVIERVGWITEDDRLLRHFLEREEQVRAFRELLSPERENAWALHYLGVGGAGKTMLLRHIGARLAPESGVPTSRIDFDYLPPDYPWERPGRLLVELAAKLRWAGKGESGLYHDKMAGLRDRAEELNAAPKQGSPTNPVSLVEGKEFGPVIRAFLDVLNLLPRAPVLILDTCEEMNKLEPPGDRPTHLEAAFAILKRVKEGCPGLRVIFAGRRFLARSGFGWSLDDSAWAATDRRLPEVPFLALHVLRGFDEEEARRFLELKGLVLTVPSAGAVQRGRERVLQGIVERFAPAGLPEEKVRAVLSRSREMPPAQAETLRPPHALGDGERYNPFDLAIYAEWLREDPGVSAATLASGSADPYVSQRIVRRLENQPNVHQALPAVALLRCFDRAMLALALPDGGATADGVFRLLGDQEWIEYRGGEGPEAAVLEVNPRLYPRLRAYYEHEPARRLSEKSRTLIAPRLAARVRETPLERLGVFAVDAALRLLPHPEGAALWDHLTLRVPLEAGWGWARLLTERLLGEEGAVGSPTHPLRAAVRALHTAAAVHLGSGLNLALAWEEVARTAPDYPRPSTREWLRRRAVAGAVAAGERDTRAFTALLESYGSSEPAAAADRSAPPEELRAQWEQLGASLCAAVDALLDLGETDRAFAAALPLDRVRAWMEGSVAAARRPPAPGSAPYAAPVELVAYGLCLAGRALLRNGDVEDGAAALLTAEATLAAEQPGPPDRWFDEACVSPVLRYVPAEQPGPPDRWFDWRPPPSLLDRVRLEVVRLYHHFGLGERLEIPTLKAWLTETGASPNSIDSERLASAIVQAGLARCLLLPDELEAGGRTDAYDAQLRPTCAAHRAVPPLAVSLARGWLALGQGRRALSLLHERIDQASRARDEATVRAAESAERDVVRRLRLHERAGTLVPRLTGSGGEEVVGAWPLAALCLRPSSQPHPAFDHGLGPGVSTGARVFQPPPSYSPAMLHAWWQSQDALRPETARQVIVAMESRIARAVRDAAMTDGLLARALELDRREMELLIERLGFGGVLVPVPNYSPTIDRVEDQGPRPADVEFRLKLRSWVLGERREISELPGGLELRRRAEIALEEGELLALRDPARARRLLDAARMWFRDVRDPFGALVASVRELIAEIHLNVPVEECRRLLDGTERDYEQLRQTGFAGPLPPWSDFAPQRLARHPQERLAVEALAPLEGWAHRLTLARTVVEGRGEDDSGSLQKSLARLLGEPLPLELQPVPDRPEPLAVGKVFRDVLRELASYVRAIGMGVSVGGVLASGLLALSSEHLPWFATLAYGVGVGTVGARAFLSFLGAARRLRLEIGQSASGGGREVERGDVALAVVGLIVKTTEQSDEPHQLRQPTTAPGLRPHRFAGHAIPVEVAEEFAWARADRLAHGGRLRIPVRVEPTPNSWLGSYCWEAALLQATWQADAARGGSRVVGALRGSRLWLDKYLFRFSPFDTYQFFRWGERLPSLPSSTPWRDRGCLVLAGRTWEGLLWETWIRSAPRVSVIRESPRLEEQPPLKVLHLVGNPLRVGDRWHLQIAEEGVQGQRAELFSPDRLPLPQTALVVVQRELTTAFSTRDDTDRERISHLRAFATEVFAAGARSVLLLPELPPRVAELVLTRLGRALASSEPIKVPELLDAVSSLRQLIASPPHGTEPSAAAVGSDTLLELALEVCLFARTPDSDTF